MQRLQRLWLVIFVITSLLAQSVAPAAIHAAPTAQATHPSCPTTPEEAAKLLSGGKSGWTKLEPTDDGTRTYVAWKYKGEETEFTYPGFGDFDHWSKGNGYKGNIPGADSGTFNCKGDAEQAAPPQQAAEPASQPQPEQAQQSPPAPSSVCPSTPEEAAALLSGGVGTWQDLGTEPWRPQRAWKFKSDNGPVTITHPGGEGWFDTWKYDKVTSGEFVLESATYNCPVPPPSETAQASAGTQASAGSSVVPTPVNPLPTSCPTNGLEASLLSDGHGDWQDMGAPVWRGYRIWKFKSKTGEPINLHYPGFGKFHYYKEEGPITHSIWTESADFHCQ